MPVADEGAEVGDADCDYGDTRFGGGPDQEGGAVVLTRKAEVLVRMIKDGLEWGRVCWEE